jgi:hypothetical protein
MSSTVRSLSDLLMIVKDDTHAMTFQSLGQYRPHLAGLIRGIMTAAAEPAQGVPRVRGEQEPSSSPASDLHAGSVDTDDFKLLLVAYRNEWDDVAEPRAALIAHINRHTSDAVRVALAAGKEQGNG